MRDCTCPAFFFFPAHKLTFSAGVANLFLHDLINHRKSGLNRSLRYIFAGSFDIRALFTLILTRWCIHWGFSTADDSLFQHRDLLRIISVDQKGYFRNQSFSSAFCGTHQCYLLRQNRDPYQQLDQHLRLLESWRPAHTCADRHQRKASKWYPPQTVWIMSPGDQF